jgi:hypothetical protein
MANHRSADIRNLVTVGHASSGKPLEQSNVGLRGP